MKIALGKLHGKLHGKRKRNLVGVGSKSVVERGGFKDGKEFRTFLSLGGE